MMKEIFTRLALGVAVLMGTAVFGQFAIAGNSACHAVRFMVTATPIDDVTFSGIVEGDLLGTAIFAFDEFNRLTGVTTANAGNATWSITGGSIPEMTGKTFVTRFDNRNVFIPGTDLVKNVGSHRALDGVAKANLSYIGEIDLSELVARQEYRGVICTAGS